MPMPLLGVIGANQCDALVRDTAFHVGKQIALRGYGMVCGGLGGVMEAAAEGCRSNGGLTVGIIPQDEPEHANPFISIVIPTGMGIMRNLLVVRSAAGLVAVDGKYGTLSELAFALQLGKPVVGVGTWNVSEDVQQFDDPVTAVNYLIDLL